MASICGSASSFRTIRRPSQCPGCVQPLGLCPGRARQSRSLGPITLLHGRQNFLNPDVGRAQNSPANFVWHRGSSIEHFSCLLLLASRPHGVAFFQAALQPLFEIRAVADLFIPAHGPRRSRSSRSLAKPLSSFFTALIDSGLFLSSSAASAWTRAFSWPSGTTSVTKPIDRASSASRILPRTATLAFFSPIISSRNTETIEGMKPIFTSV